MSRVAPAAAGALRVGAAVRAEEFPHLEGVYLNAASYAPQPVRALRAIRAFEKTRSTGELRAADFGDALARARRACGRLIGADPADIALVPNTTVGVHIAADLLRQRGSARPVIILPDGEFPANVHAWLGLERAHGFRVERVPLDERGCPDEEALLDRVRRGDVCALAISAVQFNTGYRADLEALGAACAAHDVLFVVDAIQAVGVTPLDVVAARVDVLACGGQKWLCGPFGTGFAYVRRDLVHDHAPELPGWLAFESSLDFPRLLDYRLDLWDDARRFETGTLGLQGFVGLAAAAELIDDLGVDAIAAHVAALHEPLIRWALETPGVRVPVVEPDRRAGVLAVHVNDEAFAQRALQAARITIVPPDGALRFAPHFYNTHDDIAAAVDVLNTLHAAT